MSNDDDRAERPGEDLTARLGGLLAGCPPFDVLDEAGREQIAAAARTERFSRNSVVLDAFATPVDEMFVVLQGRVELWNHRELLGGPADERLGAGGLFGFSAMLAERSVGPRVVALTDVLVARIPARAVSPVFASRRGARFLVEEVVSSSRRAATAPAAVPSYSLVDELIVTDPLLLDAATPAGEVARRMAQSAAPCAVIRTADRRYGVITDQVLRDQLIVAGRSPRAPAEQIMITDVGVVTTGDSAAEALIMMLDRHDDVLLVLDRLGDLRGVIVARDFAISPTTAGVSLHEQIRRAADQHELISRARRIPAMLGDLLNRGLASGKIIAVYSAVLDTVVRRSIGLTFDRHPELDPDAFTWLSLGSNGRREAVPSSDVDSAVAFDDGLDAAVIETYRAAFVEVSEIVAAAGLSSDSHGATAQRPEFSRTNADWRAAALTWRAAPEKHNGAMMTSLLVDGRPIHGDPGLPAVATVFGELREHAGTMRLLLQESLASRAKSWSMRELLVRRHDTFDIKTHALTPITNIGRWASLTVGSAVLPTTARLRAAGGSAILPVGQADTLVEIFEVLQRLRLRQQLAQLERGERPTDVVVRERISPLDRAVIGQAVREIAAVQRRMDNVSHYLSAEDWVRPDPG